VLVDDVSGNHRAPGEIERHIRDFLTGRERDRRAWSSGPARAVERGEVRRLARAEEKRPGGGCKREVARRRLTSRESRRHPCRRSAQSARRAAPAAAATMPATSAMPAGAALA
jgi:hypothetical protein